MQIPWSTLSADALFGVVQEFVLREGTEYGPSEISLECKVDQVIGQIKAGKVGVFYDQESGTTTLQDV